MFLRVTRLNLTTFKSSCQNMPINIATKRQLSTSINHHSKQQVPKVYVKNKLYNRRVNKFAQDKGMGKELQYLRADRDDPAYHHENINELTELEDLRDESKVDKKKFQDAVEPEKLKSILVAKKLFPKKQAPNLLTNMEKETIRYLHGKDPNEWTIDRLTESFPVDARGVKAVLKAKSLVNPNQIRKQDLKVAENWKLLSKGALDIDPELKEHLKSFERSSKPVNLTGEDQKKMIDNMKERFEVKPKLLVKPGEFTNIVRHYEIRSKQASEGKQVYGPDKVKLIDSDYTNDRRNSGKSETSGGSMETIFGGKGEMLHGTPAEGASSPYGETALMNFGIDFSGDTDMDIEKFRDMYLKRLNPVLDNSNSKTLIPRFGKDSEGSESAKAYTRWLQQQQEKAARVTKNVTKIDAEKILATEIDLPIPSKFQQTQPEPETEFQVSVEKLGGQQSSESQEIYVVSDESGKGQALNFPTSPDEIEIPIHLKNRYSFFQYGDSIYDSEGQFLYRVPGMAK